MPVTVKHANAMVDELIEGLLSELDEGLSEGGATRLVISLVHCLDRHSCVDWPLVYTTWPHEWVAEALVTAGVIPDYDEWGEE